MNRTFLGTLALLAALATLVGSNPTRASAAAAAITFNGAVTDNYKNWDKTAVRERTAWLQLKSIAVGGVTYRPTSLPQSYLFTDTEPVTGSDGSTAVVSVSGDPAIAYLQRLRTDPNGDWGPLVVLVDPATLPAKPLHLTVTVTRNGVAIASSVVDYRLRRDAGQPAVCERRVQEPRRPLVDRLRSRPAPTGKRLRPPRRVSSRRPPTWPSRSPARGTRMSGTTPR